jgi:hypothetical protein
MPWQQKSIKDVTNQRFGSLVARWPSGRRIARKNNPKSGTEIIWLCSCDCGVLTNVAVAKLYTGNTKSCGCRKRSNARSLGLELSGSQAIKHGHCRTERTPGYDVWRGMLQRCLNPNHDSYEYYGGRGIKVCEHWQGDHGFENFFADMGQKPEGKSIDRYPDKNGNYEPGNCRWATIMEQAHNKNPMGTFRKRKRKGDI